MDVVFFNQPWREKQLQEGLQVALFGKVDTYRGGLQMANPVVDLIGDRTGRIVMKRAADRPSESCACSIDASTWLLSLPLGGGWSFGGIAPEAICS